MQRSRNQPASHHSSALPIGLKKGCQPIPRRRIQVRAAILLTLLVGCGPTSSHSPTDSNSTNLSQTEGQAGSQNTATSEPELSQPSQTATTTSSPETSTEDATIEITFDEIQLPIQADIVFRPFMLSERVKELDGKKIRISGYMLPDMKTKNITQFVLLKNTECKFGPGGQADHLLNVLMTDGVTAKFRDDPVSVEGVLKINPFQGPDGNTWSLYDLACDRVEPYRPSVRRTKACTNVSGHEEDLAMLRDHRWLLLVLCPRHMGHSVGTDVARLLRSGKHRLHDPRFRHRVRPLHVCRKPCGRMNMATWFRSPVLSIRKVR